MCYQQELFAQKTPYLQWIKEQEQLNKPAVLGKQIQKLPFFSCKDKIPNSENIDADAVCIFVRSGGMLHDDAEYRLAEVFSDSKETVLAYADEDYRGTLMELYAIKEEEFEEDITAPYRLKNTAYYRGEPWLKPDFSPDTLESFFYIGSIFAIKGDTIQKTIETHGKALSLYELVYWIFMDTIAHHRNPFDKIVHVQEVLYTNDSLPRKDMLECSDKIQKIIENKQEISQRDTQEKVSVIIPSKDNMRVLCKCLETLIRNTQYKNYEIILVDNGSSEEQKAYISSTIEELCRMNAGHEITYLYEKMEFNFSRMCNIGAKAAKGAYLLFLNDDIEILDTNEGRKWLDYLLQHAKKRHVGAVGAKLYYPDKDKNGQYRMQHVGITNMGIGPAHKLGGMLDQGCLYHGHNTMNYNMIAVTAACMLIKRSTFDNAGGFDEEFAVAYNDVELCFRLHQAGLFQVQVNDAMLIHHESLSRGQDTSPEKQKRLQEEKQKLYNKYPSLKNKDPFYHCDLVQWKKDVMYNIGYLYNCDKKTNPQMLNQKDNKKLMLLNKLESADRFRNQLYAQKHKLIGKLYDKLTGYHLHQFHIDSIEQEENIITINGWYVQLNSDNANLLKKLWLIKQTAKGEARCVYEIDISPKLREDAAQLFAGSEYSRRTKNAALSGIQILFDKQDLARGRYRIGILTGKKQLVFLPDKKEVWI